MPASCHDTPDQACNLTCLYHEQLRAPGYLVIAEAGGRDVAEAELPAACVRRSGARQATVAVSARIACCV